jgi:hypothetical protein
MKNLSILIGLIVMFSLSACNGNNDCLVGEGEVESRTIQLDKIEGVQLNGNSRVFLKRGNVQNVVIKGQPNILDQLKTKIKGDVWDIEYDKCLGSHDRVEIYITVPELRSAKVNGAGYIEMEDRFKSKKFEVGVSGSGDIKGKVDAEKLESDISGSGSIDLQGATEEQKIKISGSGKYNAVDLSSRETDIEVSGSGQAKVHASDRLKADISGSGQVFYRGKPDMALDVSGSGKAVKIE